MVGPPNWADDSCSGYHKEKKEKLPYEAYELLFDAAVQFRYYESIHRAKGTYEAHLKANDNARYAKNIEDYLQKVSNGTA